MVIKRSLFLFFVAFFSIFSFSEWPIRDINYENFTSFFGENRTDHFHNGVDIVKKDSKIYPVERGDVLFYYDEEEPTKSTLGTGKYVIIENYIFRSYYCHLDSIDVKNKFLVDKSTSLGLIGNTGRSSSTHLHFAIRKDGFFVDPFDVMKDNNVKNYNPPIVEGILFKSGYFNKIEDDKDDDVTLPFREIFDIYVSAIPYDPYKKPKVIKYADIKIFDSSNNNVYSNSISFSFIENNKLNGKFSLSDIYLNFWNKNYLYLGKWVKKDRRETYKVIISVKDQWGNSKTVVKKISFK